MSISCMPTSPGTAVPGAKVCLFQSAMTQLPLTRENRWLEDSTRNQKQIKTTYGKATSRKHQQDIKMTKYWNNMRHHKTNQTIQYLVHYFSDFPASLRAWVRHQWSPWLAVLLFSCTYDQFKLGVLTKWGCLLLSLSGDALRCTFFREIQVTIWDLKATGKLTERYGKAPLMPGPDVQLIRL